MALTRCSEGQARANVFCFQTGKVRKYLRLTHPARQILEDIVDGDSRALDAGLTTSHFRIDGDSVLPGHDRLPLDRHAHRRSSSVVWPRFVVNANDVHIEAEREAGASSRTMFPSGSRLWSDCTIKSTELGVCTGHQRPQTLALLIHAPPPAGARQLPDHIPPQRAGTQLSLTPPEPAPAGRLPSGRSAGCAGTRVRSRSGSGRGWRGR